MFPLLRSSKLTHPSKSQEGSGSSRRGQGRGGQIQRSKLVSSELNVPPSTLTTPDLQQGLSTSRGRDRVRDQWSGGRTAPYPAESTRNDRLHRELSDHRIIGSHSIEAECFLAPYHIPIGTRARSATPQRLKYEGNAHMQPFYTPQGSYPPLHWEESPNTYAILGAADARQHTILSRDASGFANCTPYSDPAGPILGTSPDGYSSGLSSAGWPTPSPSRQGMIHDNLAYSPGQDSLGGNSNGQNPRIPFSTYMPNCDPYYGLSVSQSVLQYAGGSFIATENTLGLSLSAAHSPDPLSGGFEDGDPQYSSYVKSPFHEDVQNLLAPNSSATHTPGLIPDSMPAPRACYTTNLIHQNISANGNVDTEGPVVFPPHVFGTQYSHIRIPEIDPASPYDLEPLIFDKGQE